MAEGRANDLTLGVTWTWGSFLSPALPGICNTWSELTPCNAHFRKIAEWVKRGVWETGGFPLEFPVMSLGETLLRPTAMLYRNLASMDVEESIRSARTPRAG